VKGPALPSPKRLRAGRSKVSPRDPPLRANDRFPQKFNFFTPSRSLIFIKNRGLLSIFQIFFGKEDPRGSKIICEMNYLTKNIESRSGKE